MLKLLNQTKPLDFQPGVFTKCSSVIESCISKEQLDIANTMVTNNKDKLTVAQYLTLKNRLARHPCANGRTVDPNYNEYTVYISRQTMAITLLLGIGSWSIILWWALK